jgi:2-polyprenyl-3-methyl-5-hydroxy-6-metoxy-1,4-benzoquinol methylase
MGMDCCKLKHILSNIDGYTIAWAKGRGQSRKILDIGAGAGNMSHHLAHYGQVVGLDYLSRSLAVAQARALDVCQVSDYNINFESLQEIRV